MVKLFERKTSVILSPKIKKVRNSYNILAGKAWDNEILSVQIWKDSPTLMPVQTLSL